MKKTKIFIVFAVAVSLVLSFVILKNGVQAEQLVADAENPKKLFVVGTGVIEAEPDMGIVSGSIVTQEEEAAVSQSKNDECSKRVIEALLDLGIPKEDIKTSSYNVNPVYSYRSGEDPKLIGYKTVHQLTIEVKEDFAMIGKVIDAAMGAGMNQIHGIHFDIQDRSTLLKQAIEKATFDAREKAETALNPEGMGIVELQELHVMTSEPASQAKRTLDGAPEQGGSMLMPGSQTITAQVQATYIFASSVEKE